MTIEIRVPTLGESVSEATIGQWFKNAGDAVNADEPIVELETDKVTLEVPAPSSGVLAEIKAQEGDTVEVDALLGMINAEGAGAEATTATDAGTASTENVDNGSGEEIQIHIPTLGESVTEATIGQFFKAVGDAVAADEPIVELETDKVSVEVPAPSAGTLASFAVAEGDTVEVGALLATMVAGAGAASAGAANTGAAPSSASTSSSSASASSSSDRAPSPSAAKIMAEKNIDASQVSGSGKDGQILKEDVMNMPAQSAPASTSPAAANTSEQTAQAGQEERVRMSKLRQTIARRLKDAQNTAAMLTTFNDVDMTAVMELRKSYKDLFEKKHGVKLGFMSFFVKAAIQALQELPAVNAEIDGTDIVYKNYYHVGVAVGTDKGLVVPVLRNADQMSLAGIEKTITDFGRRARDGQLGIDEMQGGTFTISNGGVYGSMLSTPILNAPQSGILGMHRIEQKPVVRNGEIVIRPIMYLALSYDHRIVDGKEAVTFLVRIKENLEDPQRLILDL